MKDAIEKAARNGYLPERAVEFSGANNGQLVENGPWTMQGWSVWNMANGSSFIQGHDITFTDPKFWECLQALRIKKHD